MTILAIAALSAATTGFKAPVKFTGMYVEGCSCSPPCACELVAVKMGCEGVGAFQIRTGSFAGKDISGVKFAYATAPGDWVTCYVDAPAGKMQAASDLCKAAFGAWGKYGGAKAAKISISGNAGKYTLAVDGGKVMKLTTSPVMGIDQKSPIMLSNINSVLHPTVMQGKVVACTFNDAGHSFELKGSNAYFNGKLAVNGAL